MADRDLKVKQVLLKGKLRSADDPATIGEDFQQLTNLRYTDTHPIGIKGMTKINTTELSSYPDIKSGFHLRKDLPAESHVVVQAFNSGGTEAKYYKNSTAIPGAGDFTATALLTQSSTPDTANWSRAPNGNLIMCDGKGTYIWGGNEVRVGSFINYAPDSSFWYNYTERVQNDLSTGLANIATMYRVTESVDANTELLLHLDNNDTDSSTQPTQHTVTDTNVTYSATGATFGTHRAVFTTNANLSIPDHADFDTTGGTFTYELYLELDNLSSDYSIYYQNMIATGDDDSINIMVDTNGAVLVRLKDGGTKQFSGAVDFITSNGVITAGTVYHIAVVESGDNWYIFVDGVQQAHLSDSARTEDYDDPIKIGYDETTYLEGKIDEIRFSSSARYTTDFELPIAAFGSVTYRTYLYVGSPRPLQGIKYYIGTANTTAGSASVEYWSESSWAAVGTLVDGTETGGDTPLSQTGTMSFDSTEAVARPSIIDGIVLYWYRVSITELDATTTVYQVTLDAPMQTIKDTWDGIEVPELSFKHWDNSANNYIDFTTNVFEDSYTLDFSNTYAELGSLPTEDHLIAGFAVEQMGLVFRLIPGKENSTANTTATIYYWTGTIWTTVGILTDGTSENGISFAKSGTISWNPVTAGTEIKKEISNEVPLYYYKIVFSQALDIEIELYYVAGVTAPVTINAFKYPFYAGDSVWLLNELNKDRNRVLRSVPGHADTWNGELALSFTVGDDKDLIAGQAIYMQIGTNLYEVLVLCKKSETWMIIPQVDSLEKFLVDATKGCTAAGTMKTASLGAKDVLGAKRNVVIWQGTNAIHMYDGRAVLDIDDDIADYFDRRKSYSINRSYISASQSFFDENNHYHWKFASGVSTTLNKELVYDTDRSRWYEINRSAAKYLQCGIEVEDTEGNKYSYGGISQYMERLENGTDFDGTDITHTLWTGDIPVADSIAHMSKVDAVGLTCLATNTTTNTISGSYFRDGADSADETFTLAPQKTGRRIATPTTQDIKQQGSGIYHSFKFEMVTDDESIGFEPMYLYAYYRIKRSKLLGGS